MDGHELGRMLKADRYQPKPFSENFSAHNKRLPTLQQHQPSANLTTSSNRPKIISMPTRSGPWIVGPR